MPLFARIFGADWDGEKIVLAMPDTACAIRCGA
jgi:hypothetical protein